MEIKEVRNYNGSMAERGNKGMKILPVYLDPQILKQFKAWCAMEGKPMTKVIEEYIKKIVQSKN